MTKLKEIALAIFRKVSGDPEASWEAMSAQERENALGVAEAAAELDDLLRPVDGRSGVYLGSEALPSDKAAG